MSGGAPASGDIGQGPEEAIVHHVEQVMGTVVVFDFFGPPGSARPALYLALARARAFLHKADSLLSTYRPDSPLSRLRRGELAAADAPPEMEEVLARCATLREATAGWFDPWRMPGGVDPSGFVKGWAAQRARDLVAAEVAGVVVNAAGDVAVSGSPGHGGPFRIGIVDPRSRRRLAAVAEVRAAIATSGTYERGAHLVDPRSGRPLARAASASVSGPDLGTADALATALAVAGDDALGVLAGLPGYEALLIGFDGSVRRSAGFPLAGAGG